MLDLQDITVIKRNKKIVSVQELTVKPGKVTGLIGPNGAGKSSLLKLMALLENPTTGIIHFNDLQVFPGKVNLTERRKVSVVFQQPLMLDTTVYNNVAIGLKFRKTPKKVIKETVFYWLKQFGIDHLAEDRAKNLSGGEAQRLSIARAMATNPEILFLDEPFSALDLPTRRKLLKDFQQILKETGTTTIFISHDYHEVRYLCEDIVLMFEGKMVYYGKVEELPFKRFTNDVNQFLDEWMTPLIDEDRIEKAMT
ncbi:energy-coupling factor ABC transporter ATP-binding protein [Schinkia azotoformans]|uniref:energy-coupling factor ABC transporter ATP-binding protein n=1 Tax=Schinkia azotoformans TaxID=1454 RepID=UPI002DB99A1C|nr:ATP-binding cassette domain-containing protein [Schinkia azotoformans]MEC1718212.1 ATP-binding cassette domain-containing protein [Schinkia azotoformans]MEC1740321.1 ATP-binding cassette domain-containing protein [Schinkia azotoformans]MEC1747201.1 ATP-binding cassette domain-containing protein [Schinkia azotoformans]MEC1757345.1 ATP-binding cassette domain-containing protein [Schinkia azotoformans]MEC1768946.1 ATP-binding cassette domain-containing protein [Schinkia azotoformans]